ncbi:MAG: DUF1905 domain-containing protein [Thermomicrobiales bacterium]
MDAAKLRYIFEGEVWVTGEKVRLWFVSLPNGISEEILDVVGVSLNPWGTVPVEATVDDFTWESAMFPRKDRGCYDLPLNAKVRQHLKPEEGQRLAITVDIDILLHL